MDRASAATRATLETPAGGVDWSARLLTGDTRMDATHAEFAQLLNQILATPGAEQLPLYQTFMQHTRDHFAQEDRWMQATGFTADNCHTEQHQMVLETMQSVVAHYQSGQTEMLSRMCQALAEWFDGHAASMDAGLAQHLSSVGFDSVSETLADPSRVRQVVVSGCGSVSCS